MPALPVVGKEAMLLWMLWIGLITYRVDGFSEGPTTASCCVVDQSDTA